MFFDREHCYIEYKPVVESLLQILVCLGSKCRYWYNEKTHTHRDVNAVPYSDTNMVYIERKNENMLSDGETRRLAVPLSSHSGESREVMQPKFDRKLETH